MANAASSLANATLPRANRCPVASLMSTMSFASKRPSTERTPTDRSELPRSMSAAFAPSSTASAPRAASPSAIHSFLGVISCGFFAATNSVPTSSPAAASTMASAR